MDIKISGCLSSLYQMESINAYSWPSIAATLNRELRIVQVFIERKKYVYKWIHAVQIHVVQESTV